MSKEKLLSGCSEAVVAKWLADFAAECAEMRRLTSAPEPPGTFLTFEQLWTQKQETIKSARLCWGTDGRLKGCKHKCLRLQYSTKEENNGKTKHGLL